MVLLMIGSRIREARTARELSLSDVAVKANVSVATLSRIERDKQTLELGLFLTLMRILRLDPADLLTESEGDRDVQSVSPLVARITSLAASERTQLWRALANRSVGVVERQRRSAARNINMQVDELLAQVDYLRTEIEQVQKRLKKR
jgi:transcriptional regulator with XRE-family HTH domain